MKLQALKNCSTKRPAVDSKMNHCNSGKENQQKEYQQQERQQEVSSDSEDSAEDYFIAEEPEDEEEEEEEEAGGCLSNVLRQSTGLENYFNRLALEGEPAPPPHVLDPHQLKEKLIIAAADNKNNATTCFADLSRYRESQGNAINIIYNNDVQQQQAPVPGKKSNLFRNKENGSRSKHASFAALPNSTTWQQLSANHGASYLHHHHHHLQHHPPLSSLNNKAVESVVDNDGDGPLATQILNVRLKLEEKRRKIEQDKRRMEALCKHQRQKLSKAAFLQAISKVQSSGAATPDSDSSKDEPISEESSSHSSDLAEEASNKQFQIQEIAEHLDSVSKKWLKSPPSPPPAPLPEDEEEDTDTMNSDEFQTSIELLNTSLTDLQEDIARISLQERMLKTMMTPTPPPPPFLSPSNQWKTPNYNAGGDSEPQHNRSWNSNHWQPPPSLHHLNSHAPYPLTASPPNYYNSTVEPYPIYSHHHTSPQQNYLQQQQQQASSAYSSPNPSPYPPPSAKSTRSGGYGDSSVDGGSETPVVSNSFSHHSTTSKPISLDNSFSSSLAPKGRTKPPPPPMLSSLSSTQSTSEESSSQGISPPYSSKAELTSEPSEELPPAKPGSQQKQFYVSFDSKTPRKPKPRLNQAKSAPKPAAPPPDNPKPSPPVAPSVPPSDPLEEPCVGFVIGADLVTPDPRAQSEMEKKKEQIMLLSLRRKEQQEGKRAAKEAELSQKREQDRQRKEVQERKKEEKRLKHQAILEQYLERKAQKEADAEGAQQSPARLRPKSAGSRPRPKSAAATISNDSSSICEADYADTMTSLHSQASSTSTRGGGGPLEDLAEYTGPRLFVKPAAKSNRPLILNAVSAVLAGTVNAHSKLRVVEEIARSPSKHFLILFRDAGCQFRALYAYNPDLAEVTKLYGTGPKAVTEPMIDKFYKYNSGGKCFSQVHTKHLTVTIDAFTIHNALWTAASGKKPVGPTRSHRPPDLF